MLTAMISKYGFAILAPSSVVQRTVLSIIFPVNVCEPIVVSNLKFSAFL